ncbi:hypothetical protein ABW20_dc0109391 [Dactylellina cionopaga]|nr:hypothetical protein ABW20_dc0109391 [Dactylellina cionopaga]
MLVKDLSDEERPRLLALTDTDQGYTALHLAAASLNHEVLEFLATLKPDGAARSFDGDVALDVFVRSAIDTVSSSHEIELCLKVLLSMTPVQSINIDLLIQMAVKYNTPYIDEILTGVDLNQTILENQSPDEDGWTVFHTALHAGTVKVLRKLFPDLPLETIYRTLPKSKEPTRFSDKRKGVQCELSEDGLKSWRKRGRSMKLD